jgi:hypothetical protein
MRWFVVAVCLGVLAIAAWLAVAKHNFEAGRQRFAEHNLCFQVKSARERGATLVVSRCSDGIVLSRFQYSNAALSYRDIDNDGVREAVFESIVDQCKNQVPPCFHAGRVVLDICADCSVGYEARAQDLPNLNQVQ